MKVHICHDLTMRFRLRPIEAQGSFQRISKNINESEETIYDGADTRNDAILIGDSFTKRES